MWFIVAEKYFHQLSYVKELSVFNNVRVLLILFSSLEIYDFLPWNSMTNQNTQFVPTF